MIRKSRNRYSKYGLIFSLPFIITFLIFSLYPIIYTFTLSFSDLQGVASGDINILDNPFENYVLMWNNATFRTSLQNTVLLWVVNFIPQIILATVLAAWFTNKQLNIKRSGIFKTLFYMPNIITAASIAILFGALFGAPTGPLNDFLMLLGITDEAVHFFRNPLIAQGTVAFIQFWMWYGSTMIIMIAGINGINPSLFEAAAIDGASAAQTFFKVTLPQLKPIVLFTLVTSFIGGMQMFDIPRLLVDRSGPDNATLTTAVFIFNQAFGGPRMWNRAAAASMILFVICGVIAGSLFFAFRDKEAIALEKEKKQREKALRAEYKALQQQEKANKKVLKEGANI